MKRRYILTLTALVGPAAWGGPARLSFRHLSGPLYLATDAGYFPTNWLVYLGPKTVTVVGATWTPAMARTLSRCIRQVTRLPITAVIDTSPDPEWAGGNAYWKDTGALARTIPVIRSCRSARQRRSLPISSLCNTGT